MKVTTFGGIKKLNTSKDGRVDFLSFTSKGKNHSHLEDESVYITHGEGHIHMDTGSISVKKGDLITIPKYTLHHMEPLEGELLELMLWYH